LSADPFGPVLVLISYPFKDYDEPKTLVKQNCRSVSKAVTGYRIGRISMLLGAGLLRTFTEVGFGRCQWHI
jgi:hypothetical protein